MRRLSLFYFIVLFGLTSMATGTKVDLVVVEKSEHLLLLFHHHQLVRSYEIALGREPLGPKEFEGDGKTPEGKYFINHKNSRSNFFKALQISYPNARDSKKAKRAGLSPGGMIMIHGLRNDFAVVPQWIQPLHSIVDWTDGCIAVTNSEMDEIFNLVPENTPIWIFP